jgi:DNA-binding NtrC family response regulator
MVSTSLVDRPSFGKGITVLVVGDGIVASYELEEAASATIGRAESNQIVIDHPSISRSHALLRLGSPITIEDLGSSNGTAVRGTWLQQGEPCVVAPDEAIELGSLMLMVHQRTKAPRARRMWTHDYFEGRLEDECARPQRPDSGFGLLRIHSKHEIPLDLLQSVFAQALREMDVTGRYGPGEFEVLLVETSSLRVEQVSGGIVAQLKRFGLDVHVGTAIYPSDGRTADALLAVAGARALGTESAANGEVPIYGSSMQQLHRLVERIADSTISVLIFGETGVGKEVLAEMVHRCSPRAAKPFLRLNCAALSESLIESELFGHERGAFTGAVQAKPGLLETAEGGTVFLDEVGELQMPTQVKLLRVIEERKVQRIGGLVPRSIDVRFVAATNRDLEVEVARGTFRQDLFFRLNGIALTIPPLRKRVSEIRELVGTFIGEAAHKMKRARPAISEEALSILERYPWPGNIRELRNVVERAVLLSTGSLIELTHLPVEKMRATMGSGEGSFAPPPTSSDPHRTPPPVGVTPGDGRPPSSPVVAPAETSIAEAGAFEQTSALREQMQRDLAALEKRRIVAALAQFGGNQTEAARLLGISRVTLHHRMELYKIPRPRKRSRPE